MERTERMHQLSSLADQAYAIATLEEKKDTHERRIERLEKFNFTLLCWVAGGAVSSASSLILLLIEKVLR
jgi:hypothetical protein